MSETILRYHHLTTDFLGIPKRQKFTKFFRRVKTRLSRRKFRQFARHVIAGHYRNQLCTKS